MGMCFMSSKHIFAGGMDKLHFLSRKFELAC